MANEFFSLETLEKVAEAVDDPRFLKFVETLRNANEKGAQFSEIQKNSAVATRQLVEQTDLANNTLSKLNSGFDEASKKASAMWSDAITGLKNYINTTDGVSPPIFLTHFTNLLPDAISGMGKFGGKITEVGFDANIAFKNMEGSLKSIMSVIPGGDSKAVTELLKMAGAAVQGQTAYIGLQKEIIGIAAAQGNLSGVLGDSQKHFGDLDQEYIKFVNIAKTTAEATGQTIGSVMDLAFSMKEIPRAISEPLDIAGQRMNQLSAASKLATSVGIDQLDVTKKLSDMYTNLGSSGDVAFKSLANIYKHAGDSKLGFSDFSTTVSDIAGKFKMLGDNTIATTNIVDSFDKSIQNISRVALGDLLKGMGGKLQGLDLGQLGFISSQTGGPGGLAGGIQMEEAMATGKLDQVLSRTLEAMQNQFGGSVVTRKEAAESPELAGEYYKQVKYLTDVAGIAGNRQEAAQILEAMKTGVIDKLKLGQGETGQDALMSLIDRGSERQVASTNQVVMQTYQTVEELKLIRNRADQSLISNINQSRAIDSDLYMNKAAGRSVNANEVKTMDQFVSDSIIAGGVSGKIINAMDSTTDFFKKTLNKPSEDQTTSGMPNTINGAPIDITKPRSGTVFTNATKNLGTESQRIQVDVTNKPIDVNVNVDLNFMGEKIRAITEEVITERERNTNNRIGTGVDHSRR